MSCVGRQRVHAESFKCYRRVALGTFPSRFRSMWQYATSTRITWINATSHNILVTIMHPEMQLRSWHWQTSTFLDTLSTAFGRKQENNLVTDMAAFGKEDPVSTIITISKYSLTYLTSSQFCTITLGQMRGRFA